MEKQHGEELSLHVNCLLFGRSSDGVIAEIVNKPPASQALRTRYIAQPCVIRLLSWSERVKRPFTCATNHEGTRYVPYTPWFAIQPLRTARRRHNPRFPRFTQTPA